MIDAKTFLLSAFMFLASCLVAQAQADKRDVRAGNRKYHKGGFQEAEIDYRKAMLKDSTSATARYNLASSLYRQQDYAGASKLYSEMEGADTGADYYYNKGDAALQEKDYKTAVDAFRQALLQNPGDMDAKENYVYAKLMLKNQQNQNQQNQNQQNQNQNENQKDNNRDEDNNDKPQQQPQRSNQELSSQQAQQMLKAIQAKEKETQDKVNKEKAAALKSRQKEKNW